MEEEDTMSQFAWIVKPDTEPRNVESKPVQTRNSYRAKVQNINMTNAFSNEMEKQTKSQEKKSKPQVQLNNRNTTYQLRAPVLAGRSPNDIARMQVFNKAQNDMRQTKAMDGLLQNMTSSDSPLSVARNMTSARHLSSLGRDFSKIGNLTTGDFINTRTRLNNKESKYKGEEKLLFKQQLEIKQSSPKQSGLGQLSAQFESGGDGIAAIGYDRNGGTSYGKYQISSRMGSMKQFLTFLDKEAPDIAKKLRSAGASNTGGRRGAMPDMWRQIAKNEPERFEALQEAFIEESHYKPAMQAIIERTGLEEKTLSPAMREVIWSTAVQHGPAGAARIFDRADDVSGKANDPQYEKKLISNVYRIRAGQFGSSTEAVQVAVQNRFKQEKALALNMLEANRRTAIV